MRLLALVVLLSGCGSENDELIDAGVDAGVLKVNPCAEFTDPRGCPPKTMQGAIDAG